MDPEKLAQIVKETSEWRNFRPSSKVSIKSEPLEEALLELGEIEKVYEFKRDTVIWFHMAKMFISYSSMRQLLINDLFFLMDSPLADYYRSLVPDDWTPDIEPTPWMLKVYKQFRDWKFYFDNHPESRHVPARLSSLYRLDGVLA